MTPDLDVIIVSYNTRDGLARVPGVARRASPPRGTRRDRRRGQRVDRRQRRGGPRGAGPQVDVVALDRNVGFGAANNVAHAARRRRRSSCCSTATRSCRAGAIDTLVERLDRDAARSRPGPRLVDGARPAGGVVRPDAVAAGRSSGSGCASGWRRGGGASARRYVERLVGARARRRLGQRRVPAGAARRGASRPASSTSATSCTKRTSTSAPRCARAAAASSSRRRPRSCTCAGRSRAAGHGGGASHYDRSHLAFYEKHVPGWAPWLRGWLRLRGRAHPIESARSCPVRIAIDARKLHDYGIGTYVRNLVRELARQDSDDAYVLLCRAGRRRRSSASLGPALRAARRARRQLLGPRAVQRAAGAAARARRSVSRAALRRLAADDRARSSSRFTTASICGFRSTCRIALAPTLRARDDDDRPRGGRGGC